MMNPDAKKVLKSGLVQGKFPGSKKWVSLFLEATTQELWIYEGHEKLVQRKGRQLRTLKLDQSDLIGEEGSKKRIFRFFIQRPDGRYIFNCDNAKERGEWILQLQLATNVPLEEASAPVGFTSYDYNPPFSMDHAAFCDSWKELVKYSWFWGPMSRRDCEEKLRREGELGNFVIRVNSSDNFVMSCWVSPSAIIHSLIVQRNNLFCFDKSPVHAEGSSIIGFLESYVRQPLRRKLVPFGGHIYSMKAEVPSHETTDGHRRENDTAAVETARELNHSVPLSQDMQTIPQSHLVESSTPAVSSFMHQSPIPDQRWEREAHPPFLTPQPRRKNFDTTRLDSVIHRTSSLEKLTPHKPIPCAHEGHGRTVAHRTDTDGANMKTSPASARALKRRHNRQQPRSPLAEDVLPTVSTFKAAGTSSPLQQRHDKVELAQRQCLIPQPARHQTSLENVKLERVQKYYSLKDISSHLPVARSHSVPKSSERFQTTVAHSHSVPKSSERFQTTDDTTNTPLYENLSTIYQSKQSPVVKQPLPTSTDHETENKGSSADQSEGWRSSSYPALKRRDKPQRPQSPLAEDILPTVSTFNGAEGSTFQQRQAIFEPVAQHQHLTQQPARHQNYLEEDQLERSQKAKSLPSHLPVVRSHSVPKASSGRFQATDDTKNTPPSSEQALYENLSSYQNKENPAVEQPLPMSNTSDDKRDNETENSAGKNEGWRSDFNPGVQEKDAPLYMNVRRTQSDSKKVGVFESTHF